MSDATPLDPDVAQFYGVEGCPQQTTGALILELNREKVWYPRHHQVRSIRLLSANRRIHGSLYPQGVRGDWRL